MERREEVIYKLIDGATDCQFSFENGHITFSIDDSGLYNEFTMTFKDFEKIFYNIVSEQQEFNDKISKNEMMRKKEK